MKTLWFKVESTGKAVTVQIAENANVLELMEAIIQQHSTFFSGQKRHTIMEFIQNWS